MPWPLFLLTETTLVQLVYRRFTFHERSAPCPHAPRNGHNAQVVIGEADGVFTHDGYLESLEPDLSDTRWRDVSTCACGYLFTPADPRQVVQRLFYADAVGSRYLVDPGVESAFRAPAGAMWEAPWGRTSADPWVGPDGKCYIIRLPDGTDWCMDCPSSGGGRWDRTGVVPHHVTAIQSAGYHGWLRNGLLSDDVEGRTYER